MLLPSALSCDSSQTAPPMTRLQSALFASPPPSPPQVSSQTAIGSLFTTCRSLQSLLASPPPLVSNPNAGPEPVTPPTSSHAQLPTPPLAHAPPPLRLRLRSRKTDGATAGSADLAPPRKRIVKRSVAVAPARGPNKRRRSADDDMGRDNSSNSNNNTGDDGSASDMEQDELQMSENLTFDAQQDKENEPQQPTCPHTPKRSRIAPEVLPLGLGRIDYHELHHAEGGVFRANNTANITPPSSFSTEAPATTTEPAGTDVVVEADGEAWSTEEDRILVELVLEKLKLTKSEWQDCARSLGKDRSSVGRRWKSLMINGDVGLLKKGGSGSRRARIHGTWR